MSKSRLDLDAELRDILGPNGNLYFQPTSNVHLKYPCIIYSLASIETKKADNLIYLDNNRYDIQVIDKDPDTELPKRLLAHFRMISFGRMFITDNLYHYNFNLYY